MAVAILTAEEIELEVLRIAGFRQSSRAPWHTTERLLSIMNGYGQRLGMKLNGVARSLGIVGVGEVARFDMWRTVADLTIKAGQQVGYLPGDYDHYVSFWDSTNRKRIDVIQDVDKFHPGLRTMPAGAPEYVEILDFVPYEGEVCRQVKVHPATESGITPSISVTYWRLPRAMNDLVDSPDCDPKYGQLWIYGTACEVLRPGDGGFARYQALEAEMLNELAATAKAIH